MAKRESAGALDSVASGQRHLELSVQHDFIALYRLAISHGIDVERCFRIARSHVVGELERGDA